MSKSKNPIILFLSDLHVGSTVGIMPAKYKTINGQTVTPNDFQLWMLDNWKKNWAEFHQYRKGRPYWLVLNGDLTEGIHHRTTEVWSPDAKDHALAAIDLLEPHTETAEHLFISLGTECHTRNDEMSIGVALGAEADPNSGHHAWNTVLLQTENHLIHVRHHMPATSRVYLEGSALSIMLGNIQLSYARHKQEIPDIVVHSHRHRCGIYYDDESMAVALPAWQALTRHGQKVVPGAIPKVGHVVMDWVRGDKHLPYTFVIKQPMPPKMEKSFSW